MPAYDFTERLKHKSRLTEIVSERKAPIRPVVVDAERVKHVLAGAFESTSEEGRVYQTRILLSADAFCTCAGSSMGGNVCKHAVELLRCIADTKEFRRWVLDSAVVRKEAGE